MLAPWVRELRELHDAHFSYDWGAHLAELNRRMALTGPDAFGLPPGLPPSWFVGDVEALKPGEWVLVISLNQARREEDDGWHAERKYTSQTYWDHWRFLNRSWWEPRFYRPFVRLASVALDTPVDADNERDFATERMIFVELCPYPSRRFGLAPSAVGALAAHDLGFQLAARIRALLIAEAAPAFVMVNGAAAVDNFVQLDPRRPRLREQRYVSASRPNRELHHWEGTQDTPAGRVPVVGFPFLRRPKTHNSSAEIDQLGIMTRALGGREQHARPGAVHPPS